MIDKASLEQFLRINGISPTASDQEIKSVLLSARWENDDVDTAMLVLRENTATHESSVDSVHKVFRSDERLTPESVSKLLGISMDATDILSAYSLDTKYVHLPTIMILIVSFLTFALAMAFVAGSMWMLKVGPFHQTVLAG